MKRIICMLIAGSFALTLSCGAGAKKEPAVTENTQIYIVGGGIAGLSAAVFALRDGHVPGKNIHILEESKDMGGALDAKGSADKGYVCRGARLINEKSYSCFWDLLSSIPSLSDPKMYGDGIPSKSVKDEIFAFNKKVKLNAKARIIDKDLSKRNVNDFGLSLRDRLDIAKLVFFTSEDSIENRRIDEWFRPGFFKTNFWLMYAQMFGFETWHSLIECKRYFHRFVHDVYRMGNLTDAGWNTPYNNYESVVLPIVKLLTARGVDFEKGCEVTDLDFKPGTAKKTVERIHYIRGGEKKTITVNGGDYVFVSIGSKVADSRPGSMTTVPVLERGKLDGGWRLWKNLAKKQPGMGNPSAFSDHIDDSKWVVFSVTLRDPTFFKLYERLTGNFPGEGHLNLFSNSNWLMSIHIPFQPFFKNQPKDVGYFIAYGLLPDRPGNYVKKKMTDCTGAELLSEVCYHLGFIKEMPRILKTSTCVPYMLPYVTSQFLVRKKSDRPPVVPEGSTNLALLGQFVEIPDDVVYTVEYSVRSAQIGVYTLLNVDRGIPAIYKGLHNPYYWGEFLLALHR